MRQQVSVQVSFAGVALGTVSAGVRTNAAVRQHVFLQIELPPETFTALWTREGLLPWTTDRQTENISQFHEGTEPQRPCSSFEGKVSLNVTRTQRRRV